jgi:hypothetical protein
LLALLSGAGPWYRRRRVVLPVAGLAAYSLCGFLLVPALVRHYVPQLLREHLGVQASLGDVRFNPLLFRFEARDFALAEGEGTKLAGFGRLFVDFELSSLFRRAWTFADVRLERPELHLVLEKDGRLNLQRLLDALPPSPPEPADRDAAPPRVLFQHAEVGAARVRFSDLGGTQPASTDLGPVDLRFDGIATIREHRGPYTVDVGLPGGARLSWRGEVSLHPLASDGRLQLQGFQPGVVWDFARERLRLAPPRGVIDATLRYDFALAGGSVRLRADELEFGLRDLAVQREEGGAPLLELQGIELHGGRFDLGERRFSAAQLRVHGGRAAAAIDEAGVLDWSTLLAVPADPVPPAPDPGAAPAGPWRTELDAVALEDIGLELRDATRKAPLALDLQLRRLGFGFAGTFGADAPQLQLGSGALELADVVLGAGTGSAPLARLGRVVVEGAGFDLAAQRVDVRRVGIEGLAAAVARRADGSIRESELLAARATDAALPPRQDAAPAPWNVTLGELALTGIAVGFSDASVEPPLAYAVKDGRVTLKDVQSAGERPFAIEALLPVVQGGEIGLAGTATIDGSALDAQLRLAKLALAPLAPLVASRTTLALDSGNLSADAQIALRRATEGGLGLEARGALGVEDLMLRETGSGDRLLSWRALDAKGIDFRLAPDRLVVRELRLTEPGAKLVVYKDRTVNLATIVREPPAPPDAVETAVAEASPAEPAAPVGTAADAPEPFPVSIERVRVDDATVDFADFSLILPFAARIEHLKGVASGISSSAQSRATLAFRGRVGEFGEAEIDGLLAPFDATRFTDIEVSFRNIAMSPFSPYSATFAGRTIQSGDLDLDLEYKVDGGMLAGQNQIVLQDFRLGETVASPGALQLPLDLAIALLTDAQGRIDVSVPVSGNVGDPAFSYGHVIWQALGNLVTGVVAAPFRALGSLFGAEDAEAMQSVRFRSGSAELMPREQERIAKVAGALAARPQIGVAVPTGVEAERDGYAVRRLAVRRAIAAELGHELEPGEDPGPVAYDNAKSQRALELLLAAREGDDAPDAFAAAYAQKEGREPERVNPALALLGNASEDREYYRALYLELVRSTPEPSAELDALARGRADAIVAEFLRRGVDPARVAVGGRVALAQAKPAGVMLPLELVAHR